MSETVVFFIVVFFGQDPVGILLDKTPYSTLDHCLEVASTLDAVPGQSSQTRSHCVKKAGDTQPHEKM
jgi:hypothetical protein